MTPLNLLLFLVGLIACFWALYLLVVPLLVAGRRESIKRIDESDSEYPLIVVLVPAHEMERFVGRCVRSIIGCGYPRDRVEVFVIADNCTDETVDQAESAGATALSRNEEPRGKTYALAWGICELDQRGVQPDLFVVVDATVEVAPGFLAALAMRIGGGEHIVVGHAAVHPGNKKWFTQCIGLSMAHRNLQNSAREQLGLSTLIEGRAMAYSRTYIGRHGWRLALPETGNSGSHPTEDWRHGVRAVENGYRVAYEARARVFTPLRESLGDATRQGIRWEQGRTGNAMTYGLELARKGFRKRRAVQIMTALDAMQPPVAILGGVGLVLAAVAFYLGAALTLPVLFVCIAPMVLVGLYSTIVLRQGYRDGIAPVNVLWAPVYVAWRCMAFVIAIGFMVRNKVSRSSNL